MKLYENEFKTIDIDGKFRVFKYTRQFILS